jgi:hypothetical protein
MLRGAAEPKVFCYALFNADAFRVSTYILRSFIKYCGGFGLREIFKLLAWQ